MDHHVYNVEAWLPGSPHRPLVLPNLLPDPVRRNLVARGGLGLGTTACLYDAADILLNELAGLVTTERVPILCTPAPHQWVVQPVAKPFLKTTLMARLKDEVGGVDGHACLFVSGRRGAGGYVTMNALGVSVDAHRVACFMKHGAPGQAHPPSSNGESISQPWSPARHGRRSVGVMTPVDLPVGYDNVAMHTGWYCRTGSMLGKTCIVHLAWGTRGDNNRMSWDKRMDLKKRVGEVAAAARHAKATKTS